MMIGIVHRIPACASVLNGNGVKYETKPIMYGD